jgi:hypothetical protein
MYGCESYYREEGKSDILGPDFISRIWPALPL